MSKEVAGVDAVGQRQHSQVKLSGNKQLQNFVGSFLACIVSIQNQGHGVGVPLQQTNHSLALGRAQHGNDSLDALLMGHDDVRIAFHHHNASIACNRFADDVESVQLAALAEQTSFGRVDIFW